MTKPYDDYNLDGALRDIGVNPLDVVPGSFTSLGYEIWQRDSRGQKIWNYIDSYMTHRVEWADEADRDSVRQALINDLIGWYEE